ncbi:hypothetical protein [Thermasporomyces composti]|jgi:hypothetical protein|uniref:Uncharacterized protein n=1 Tax=Thermasporomyces composti TaxID=696763 RepID=A0A3D9V4N0_THECX|nr:hypothetical protein [Thermasporomyces composti]REF36698.1 hypothetical protein DFJ64_2118 [Thermasporomyces composti]
MTELRGLLGLLLVFAVLAQGLRGLLLGLTIVALNELLHQLLRLERPWRRPRSPGPQRTSRGRWLRPPSWLRRAWSRRPRWLRLPSWLRQERSPSRTGFPSYDRILGEIAWASYSRRDFDTGLRVRLLDALAVRLADEHGVDLRAQPDLARQRLGDDAWALLAPDRPPSRDRDAPGVDLPELDRVVTAIERLRRTHERNA